MTDPDPFKTELEQQGSELQRLAANDAAGTADESPQELPERIGRYAINALLGQGGFGVVYLGYDDELARRVAIKVPHAGRVSRPEDAQLSRCGVTAQARGSGRAGFPFVVPPSSLTPVPLLLVSEVLVKYLEYPANHYGLKGDNASKECRAMIDAVALVDELYADSTANEFGG